jgi:hypothetical protein
MAMTLAGDPGNRQRVAAYRERRAGRGPGDDGPGAADDGTGAG